MRENEKERELLKASRPKTLVMIWQKSLQSEEKVSSYSAAWDLYTAQSQANLRKSMNWPLLHEGQFRQK